MSSIEWLNSFINMFISVPLSKHLFKVEGDEWNFDWSQTYIVGYDVEGKNGLIEHTDDSEVTINVCLSEGYVGGELGFGGMRGEEGEFEAEVKLRKGGVVLHYGRQIHGVKRLEGGERYVCITWCRDTKWREEVCPCCFLNNRGKRERCICGKSWN